VLTDGKSVRSGKKNLLVFVVSILFRLFTLISIAFGVQLNGQFLLTDVSTSQLPIRGVDESDETILAYSSFLEIFWTAITNQAMKTGDAIFKILIVFLLNGMFDLLLT